VIGQSATVALPYTVTLATTGEGGRGIIVGADSRVNLEGKVDTEGDRAHGISLDEQADLTLGGTINTSGDQSNGIGADGSDFDITVTEGGSIGVTGADASGVNILLGDGSATTINVLSGGAISASGEEGHGVDLSSNGGTASATINVDEGASVFAAQDAAIAEGGGGSVDTELTVRGRVEGPNDSDTAIDLAGGDDTLIVFPTAEIIGGVDLGSGNDTLVFDGEEGTTGTVEILAGTVPFAIEVEQTIKRGAGTWIFGGDDIPADAALAPISVEEGTAVLNANLLSADVTIETNGRGEGTGSLRNITNRGAFSPGGANQIGTYTVTENLRLETGGSLEIDIAADGSSDEINVAGTTALGGALAVNGIDYPTGFPNAQEYTIITSEGGVTGTFDTVSDNLPDVDVVAAVLPAVTVLDDDGNPVTDEAGNDIVLPDRVVVSYDRGGDESDRSIFANGVEAAVSTGRLFAETLRRRDALGLTAESNSSTPIVSFQGSTDNTVRATSFAGSERRAAVWGSALGGVSDVDDDGATQGYDARTGGLVAGVDVITGVQDVTLRAGLAGGYSRTDVDSGFTEADIDTWHIGVHASAAQGPVQVTGALSYGFQREDLERLLLLGDGGTATATGDANGDVFNVSLGASYDLAPQLGIGEGVRIAPIVTFDYIHASRDGYTESGAGILNQQVGDVSIDRGFAGFGIQFASKVDTADGVSITPSLTLMYENAFGDDEASVGSSIPAAAGAIFNTQGGELGQNFIRAGLGLGIQFSENISAHIGYDGSFSSEERSHRGSIGATMNF